MVRRREVDDGDDDEDGVDADEDDEAHTSTYSSAGKKSASKDLDSELLELD